MKSIYLAGFDVFRTDAVARGEQLKGWCRAAGFEGVFPLDKAAPDHLSGPALAQCIYEANRHAIEQADLVLANLNPFRGAEPDSGTAFEVGYAVALGKPVWSYTDQVDPLIDQIELNQGPDGNWIDNEGFLVEDFGLNLNLMLACSTRVVIGNLERCLEQICLDELRTMRERQSALQG